MSHTGEPQCDTAVDAYFRDFIARRRQQEEQRANKVVILNQAREQRNDVLVELLARVGISKQAYLDLVRSKGTHLLANSLAGQQPTQKADQPRELLPPALAGLPPRPRPNPFRRRTLAGRDRPCQISQVEPREVARYYTEGERGVLNSDNFAIAESQPDPDVGVWVASESHDLTLDAPQPYRPTFAGVLYAFTPSSDGNLSVTASPQLQWVYTYIYPFFAPFAEVAIEMAAYLEISQLGRDLTEGSADLTLVNLHQFNHSESTFKPWRYYLLQGTAPVTVAGGPVIINLGVRGYTQGHWPGDAEGSIAFYIDDYIELELCAFDLF